jgi:DNA-binding HxlR family transcriptional regulator
MTEMRVAPLHTDPRIDARREPAPDCSIEHALGLIPTRSALVLLREAFYGVSRFDEFVARAGVSEPVAAARLKELVAHGLLEREPYREPGQRTRYAYRLTEKGGDLLPVLVALLRWGDRWVPAHRQGGPVALTHLGCGGPVEVELRCAAGHHVSAPEIHVAPTPKAARGPRRER